MNITKANQGSAVKEFCICPIILRCISCLDILGSFPAFVLDVLRLYRMQLLHVKKNSRRPPPPLPPTIMIIWYCSKTVLTITGDSWVNALSILQREKNFAKQELFPWYLITSSSWLCCGKERGPVEEVILSNMTSQGTPVFRGKNFLNGKQILFLRSGRKFSLREVGNSFLW